MKTFFRHLVLLVALFVSLRSAQVFAGGPLLIFDASTRTPFAYDLSNPVWGGSVPVFTDLDPSFGHLTNAEAAALTVLGFAEWTAVPTSSFSATVVGDFSSGGGPFTPNPDCPMPLPDITGTTAGLVVGCFNGGGFQVMYDHDGSIISSFFGAPPGVLGIASPDFALTGTPELIESWAVVNGTAVDPGDITPFPGASFAGVFTHEFGHAINLAHTQTNGAVLFFGDDSAPAGCPPFSGLTFADTETMYPFIDPSAGSVGIDMATIDRLDDIAAISNLYPTGGWPGAFPSITGTIFHFDGSEITGVNVIARNVADPFGDAISALSGDFTQGALGPDGLYTFNGLTPGAEYVVYVDAIVAGGFSTPPTLPLPGPEEFWNDALESADIATDDPCDVTAITAAGSFTADIIFNGDPSVVLLGDDDFEERPLPFDFPFCGTDYGSVFVGSNGFLTFGGPPTGTFADFVESVPGLLGGPPRIAGLWHDLSPNAGGVVTAEVDGPNFKITYSSVPEFPATGANTFSITLRPDGSFNIDYGTMSATDGLTGRSPGLGNFTIDPGEIDVSTATQPITGLENEAVYEIFTASDNDLSDFGGTEWLCPDARVAFAPAEVGICYATTGGADGGRLLTIDPVTGAGTLVGPTGLSGAPGLAINSKGEMFVTERTTGDLYRMDAATGTVLLIGSTGVTFLDAIAFDGNDVLYGIGFDPPFFNLRIIDTETGASSIVGPTSDIYTGMAFDPTDGQLYASVGGFQAINPDAIARIDKATGAATIVGTTGLGGPTPDIHFDDDGNMFGSKGGGQSINDLIAINKTTGAGSVIGSIGFPAVSGLAFRHLPHNLVLLADEEIIMSKHKLSEGNIHSNKDIVIKKGKKTTHNGNITAVNDISIEKKNTINGDVTAGDDVENDGTVNGVITNDAAVGTVPLPTLAFTAGGDDIEVEEDETLALDPGSYGEVEVDKEATLQLTAGEYFFESLELDKEARLSVDVEFGAAIINIEEDFEI
ncbi:hypothetical protein MJD09_22845, partial [bacterium]|nr:hypothetical protein [bacterium]